MPISPNEADEMLEARKAETILAALGGFAEHVVDPILSTQWDGSVAHVPIPDDWKDNPIRGGSMYVMLCQLYEPMGWKLRRLYDSEDGPSRIIFEADR